MKKYKWIRLGYLIVFIPIISFAQACDRGDTKNSDCKGKQFTLLQNEIKQKYQTLKVRLTPNQKKHLQYSQLAWMKQRELSCGQNVEDTTVEHCYLEAMQIRDNWLETQISMCKEQHCQTIALDR